MAKTGFISYLKAARGELKKVSWPSRKETIMSTIAVFIMVTLAALFLYFADQIIAYVLQWVLSF
jgi:preprotein translocase subunit SecE